MWNSGASMSPKVNYSEYKHISL